MKKIIASTLMAATLLTGCAQTKVIEGVRYDTYGLFTQSSKQNPDIQYEVSGWSIFWSIVLVETVIAPVYFLGFDLFQPVDKIDSDKPKGSI